MPLRINEHAIIQPSANAGYELVMDMYVDETKDGKKTGNQKIRPTIVGYYSTIASALNGYVEHSIYGILGSEKDYSMNEFRDEVRALKTEIIDVYQNHLKA